MSDLATNSGLSMPEVAIYESPDINAFATGPNKRRSLVAVSTGLLMSTDREQTKAVLAHEIAHIKNGDMVTLALMQGALNTFANFFARVFRYAVDKAVFKDEKGNAGMKRKGILSIFAMHPDIEDRIEALSYIRTATVQR